VSDKQWEDFYRIVRICLVKFIKKGWLRRKEYKETYDETISVVTDSGVPYRMTLRPESDWGDYIYSWVKGYLWSRFKEKAKAGKEVSYEELAEMKVM
jgi:hypothetical protein